MHSPVDLVKGVVIDGLHCLLLGVTLHLLNLWFDKRNRDRDFYVGDKVCCTCTFIIRYVQRCFLD